MTRGGTLWIVDPDEAAHELPHLSISCLQIKLFSVIVF